MQAHQPSVETGEELDAKFFSIGDLGIVFDILRNKLYSNPVLAVCREISCNARDAHREVGNPDLPIQIHIPNALEPYFEVKDFGPGISPDRVENIFIRYASSTKRNDNVQTGYFGLGSKSPFAVSDTFLVTTTHNSVKYSYSCFIDETNVGKIALLSTEPSIEKNGTEIRIPVQPKDFTTFAIHTEESCRYWKVKPIILGRTIEWKEQEILLQGSNWSINKISSYGREIKIIVDSIEYSLDFSDFQRYSEAKLFNICRHDILMYFENGEISLSANREQIYLNDKTKKIIIERLALLQKEIIEVVVNKISSLPNLWEANVFFNKKLRNIFNSLSFLGQLTWHGHEITKSEILLGCPSFLFSKVYEYSDKESNRYKRYNSNYLSFEDNAEVYINDLPLLAPTYKHVKKAFENDHKLKYVYVICPNDKTTLQNLNDKIHLDLMNTKNLSSITTASIKTSAKSNNRLLLFKFNNNRRCFQQVSLSSSREDINTKVLCLSNKKNVVINNKVISDYTFNTIAKLLPNISFYCVDEKTSIARIKKDFANFENLQKVLDDKLFKNYNFLLIKHCEDNFRNGFSTASIEHLQKLKNAIHKTNSIFLKYLDSYQLLNDLHEDKNKQSALFLYEEIYAKIERVDVDKFVQKNPIYNFEIVNREFNNKYPLLSYIDSYSFKELSDHIVKYINLIDSTN